MHQAVGARHAGRPQPAEGCSIADRAPLTPDEAIAALVQRYDAARRALRGALHRLIAEGTPPTASDRAGFCYPALRLSWQPRDDIAARRRAWPKLQEPGIYETTITEPAAFAAYLREQLHPLVREYGAELTVQESGAEIPFSYALDHGEAPPAAPADTRTFARHFAVPSLAAIGDEIADGLWQGGPGGGARPLALFDAPRVDFSLRRLVHYTGTNWRDFQPWILLTNYHRYMDRFVRHGLDLLRAPDSGWARLLLPGGAALSADTPQEDAAALIEAAPWHHFQMPAYHLTRHDDSGGVTMINIGVGPANAKTITDHLAVLRPHCWLMIGHCAGLRGGQVIGDYVLAHAYLRRDHVLDDILPPEIPVPALAEIQVALQQAAAQVTGAEGEALKQRLRTGTVVTYDDRNWELRWSQERQRINLSRAVAADMESGTLAAQGFRLRVPYGALLCVSDKPLHGEIKLPGSATAFYRRAVDEHLAIGLAAIDILRGDVASLHSRKLRSFDEPPFR